MIATDLAGSLVHGCNSQVYRLFAGYELRPLRKSSGQRSPVSPIASCRDGKERERLCEDVSVVVVLGPRPQPPISGLLVADRQL